MPGEHAQWLQLYSACRECLLMYTARLLNIGSHFPSFRLGLEQVVLELRARWVDESPPPRRSSRRSLILGGGFGSTGSAVVALILQHLNYTTWRGQRELFEPSHPRERAFALKPSSSQQRFSVNMTKPYVYHFDTLFDSEGRQCKGFMYSSDCIRNRLRQCYEQLDASDRIELLEDAEAVLDGPVPYGILELLLAFPAAKVILTTRSPREWADFRRENYADYAAPIQRPCGLGMRHVHDDGLLTQLMLANEQLVRCATPPSQLLELPQCSYELLSRLAEPKPRDCHAPANALSTPFESCATRSGLIYTPTAECAMGITWEAGVDMITRFLASTPPSLTKNTVMPR